MRPLDAGVRRMMSATVDGGGLTMLHAAGRRPAAVGALRVAAMALLLASASACNLDTDFADDLVEKTAERNQRRLLEQQRRELPLPDPAVVPYISVPAEEMALDEDFRVDLVDDLVIGKDRTDPNYLFVRFTGSGTALGNIAVADDGRLFVLEARSDEVRVFDESGTFLSAFGQPGEGPGDLYGPFGLLVAGERVHVFHRRYSTSIWDLDGNFLRDRETLRTPEALEAAQFQEASRGTNATSPSEAERRTRARVLRTPTRVIGRPDGSLIMVFRAAPTEPKGRISTPTVSVIGRFVDGKEVQRYLEVPDWASPSIAVSREGEMYVGMFGHLRTEHYVIALDAEARPRWVLTTPWDIDTPPNAGLRVDGHGRLFVFPNFLVSAEETRSPVQAYTRDGALIGSGYMNRLGAYLHWQATTADRIYGVRINPASEEWEVVRYRLEVGVGGS